ncbi:E3 ubiquitin-protein ligase XIAP-like [Penaeus chinensis]|uniref:E3 ubiquitin-protein ligase XIAP-like n=1 Tax=Penaeus chinensis TaxID=139456 RepID=UPI001FB5B345|nr:E3 ubiquitin-protein ligase XIAP-like [Penaeus chinensis]
MSHLRNNPSDDNSQLDAEDIKMKVYRINTFKYHRQYTHHPIVIARAGFYKVDQSVVCFKCDLEIDISEINKGETVGNVPVSIGKILNTILNKKANVRASDKIYDEEASKTTQKGDEACEVNQNQESNTCITATANKYASSINSNNKIQLSETGILSIHDHVYCFHCNVGIRNWEKDDNPWVQHAMGNPECPYIRIKMGQAFIDQVKKVKQSLYKKPATRTKDIVLVSTSIFIQHAIYISDSNDYMFKREYHSIMKEFNSSVLIRILNIWFKDINHIPLFRLWDKIINIAKEKNYLLTNTRFLVQGLHRSFSNWPLRNYQSPKILVEVGFYHTGISEHVQCFHCGVGLRNWEWGDDPWELHAKWYPDCSYVHLKKEKTFINKVRVEESYVPLKITFNISQDQHDRLEITKQDWNNLLGLENTRNLLIQGFPVIAVRDALCDQILQTDIPFSSEAECVQPYGQKSNRTRI